MIGVLIVICVSIYATYLIMGMKRYPISEDRGIPFYSTASHRQAREATDLIRREKCRDCHSLWAVRNMMQAVPAPSLDGMGMLHDEAWFFRYFSSKAPQSIIPSRLKKKYRMPSYAVLPEKERRLLASYMASLKVKDWYLMEVKRAEYEKLTGHPLPEHP